MMIVARMFPVACMSTDPATLLPLADFPTKSLNALHATRQKASQFALSPRTLALCSIVGFMRRIHGRIVKKP